MGLAGTSQQQCLCGRCVLTFGARPLTNSTGTDAAGDSDVRGLGSTDAAAPAVAATVPATAATAAAVLVLLLLLAATPASAPRSKRSAILRVGAEGAESLVVMVWCRRQTSIYASAMLLLHAKHKPSSWQAHLCCQQQ
jgi:hypothetical protein